MNDVNKPPLGPVIAAAAGGGFAGALVGVVAAGMLNGNGDNGDPQSTDSATQTQAVEVVVAKD